MRRLEIVGIFECLRDGRQAPRVPRTQLVSSLNLQKKHINSNSQSSLHVLPTALATTHKELITDIPGAKSPLTAGAF